jgi:hypothetical protein
VVDEVKRLWSAGGRGPNGDFDNIRSPSAHDGSELPFGGVGPGGQRRRTFAALTPPLVDPASPLERGDETSGTDAQGSQASSRNRRAVVLVLSVESRRRAIRRRSIRSGWLFGRCRRIG